MALIVRGTHQCVVSFDILMINLVPAPLCKKSGFEVIRAMSTVAQSIGHAVKDMPYKCLRKNQTTPAVSIQKYVCLFSSCLEGNKIPISMVEFHNIKNTSKLSVCENLTELCRVYFHPVQYFDYVLAASIVQSPNGIALVVIISKERNGSDVIFGG